jgi:penicillin-binding protein 2
VVSPIGTANSAHITGVDFAGKTGSAQVVSNEARKVLKGSEFKDNGWFAGVVPRRNPEIVVVALFEQGEHGDQAAQIVSKVVRAYAEKKKMITPMRKASVDSKSAQNKELDVAALWSNDADGDADHLSGGHFKVDLSHPAKHAKPTKKIALALPAPSSHMGGQR